MNSSSNHQVISLAYTGVLLASFIFGACTRDKAKPPPTTAVKQTVQKTLKSNRPMPMEACADCHPEQFEAFKKSGMGRSLYTPESQPAIEDFDPIKATVQHPAMPARYRAYIDKQGVWWQEELIGADYRRRVRVRYIIGSGNHSRSYLGMENGELIQLPLTWYSQAKRWDMSPGYEGKGQMRFMRTIMPECLFCHNGLTPHVTQTASTYEWPLQEGIDCSRCHGPGKAHVQNRLKGLSSTNGAALSDIINPAKLSPEKSYQICEQCHLQGHVRVLHQNQRWDEYSVATPLSAFMSVYGLPSRQSQMSTAGHGERLRMSPCAKSAKRSFQCSTCHSPHGHTKKDIRQVCADCHSDAPCPLPAGRVPQADCVKCHMVKRGVNDAPHMSFTDHFIAKPQRRHGRSRGQRDKISPLNTILESAPNSKEAQMRYAIADAMGSTRGDAHLYRLPLATRALQQALADAPRSSLGWALLGKALSIQGDLEGANGAFDEAHRLGTLTADALEGYADTLLRLGQFKKAQAVLGPATKASKANGVFLGLLATALNGQKQYQAADRAFAKAMQRLPKDSTVALNRGNNALHSRDPARAGILWNQALELDPLNVAARMQLIRLHRANKEPDEVQSLAVEGNTLLPQNGGFLLEIARISAQQEPYLKAYMRYNRVIRAQSTLLAAYIELAELAARNGEDIVANDAIERGRRAIPTYPGWQKLKEKYRIDKTTQP
jgi:cytochrome c-type biogenesis protein CcmH/NrfG